jgi:hypothetical protein
MNEDEAAARAAGLGEAWRARAEEIAEAAAQARVMAQGFRAPADETAEPMPAFAVPAPASAAR